MICFMSFYYTERVALYMKNNNPIYQEIEKNSIALEVSSIDGMIIDNKYIIPGLYGKKINKNASLRNMNNIYDETKLVFYSISPEILLEDHKDKIIIRGNEKNKEISIIFEKITNISEYLIKNNYPVNLLITEERYNTSYEMINYAYQEQTYYRIDKFLSKNKLNKNICFTKTDTISSLCNNKYVIKPSLILNKSNFSYHLNKIHNGEIILIENTLTEEQCKLLLNYISSKNIKIVTISNLLKEDR